VSLSALRAFQDRDFHRTPFPHLIVRDALPSAICDQLIKEYPTADVLGVDASRNNVRWNFPTSRVRESESISNLWKEIIDYHSSPAFLGELVDVFGESLLEMYPQQFRSRQQLKELTIGVRGVDSFSDKEILLDAQISGNTPVTRTRSVRPTHIDGSQALFAGLLYLRAEDDDSIGGDLEIRRFRDEVSDAQKPRCFRNATFVADKWTEVVKTVKYERNVLIVLVNGIDSLHGVTPRHPTSHSRIFMNLLADMEAPLFHIASWRKSLNRFRKRVLGKTTGS
jgi:hypothetical protein